MIHHVGSVFPENVGDLVDDDGEETIQPWHWLSGVRDTFTDGVFAYKFAVETLAKLTLVELVKCEHLCWSFSQSPLE
jgi:hypothetical protein